MSESLSLSLDVNVLPKALKVAMRDVLFVCGADMMEVRVSSVPGGFIREDLASYERLCKLDYVNRHCCKTENKKSQSPGTLLVLLQC